MRAFTSILVFMLSVAIQSGPVSSEAQLSQLLFVKLRPEGVGGKKRTKDELDKAITVWRTDLQVKLATVADMTAAARELLVVEVLGSKEDALEVKDELLAAVGEVYEVALKDGTTFRREGDKPLEEVKRSVLQAARELKEGKLVSTFKKFAKAQGLNVGPKILKKLKQKLSKKREEEL